MKKPSRDKGTQHCECSRSDSPICYIHFSHPFVYLETPEEIQDEYDLSSASDEESQSASEIHQHAGVKDIPSVESLLPFERALEGPSKDLLTQILFPDLSKSEAEGNLSSVLKMLREAWTKSRPNSGSAVAQTSTTTTTTTTQRQKNTSTSRRRLSAPETRIRRYTVRTTTTTFNNTDLNKPNHHNNIREFNCKSAPPIMCTDSLICQDDHTSNMINKYNNSCYCHTFSTQNEFKFSCKMNFEETTTRYNYNCNYIDNRQRHLSNNSHDAYYIPKLIPRYSSLPRTLSMLANCSSPSTSTSSGSSSDNDEECQSLADSLEDLTRCNSRLTYDEKPVRGGPPLLPHRHAPRAPIPKGETFFIPLSERNNEINDISDDTSNLNNTHEFILPQTLKEKLEKRKKELENRPKINRSVIVAQKSPRPVRSRRVIGTKFQRFECIPEELEPKRRGRNRFPVSRTYVPRAPLLNSTSRGLQAIVRDNHEAKIGLQDMGISNRPSSIQNKPGLQGILPANEEQGNNIQDLVPLNRNNKCQDIIAMPNRSSQGIQGILPVPRGKQAMGEQDLVAVTTGWVNFYMLRGEEQSTGSSDNNTTGPSQHSRHKSRGRTTVSRGSSVTEVSVSGHTSTVRVQQQPRPRTLTQRRTLTADNEEVNDRSLPRLPPASAGDRSTNGQQGTTLPSLSRNNVPMIRVKHPTNEDSSLTSETGSITLPALPPALTGQASTSSSDTPRIRGSRGKSSSSSSGTRSYVPSARRVPRQSRQQALAKANNTAIAETTPTAPGTWSVTVTGVCPQPEMEVRLVFPPTSDNAPSATPAVTNAPMTSGTEVVTPAVMGQASQQSDSGLGEENGAAVSGVDSKSSFTLMFKNQNQQTVATNGASSRGARSSASSRRGSPITSPKRRPSLKALPSTEMVPAVQSNETESALDTMMWPEMQALLQEQVINIKKQHTITRGDVNPGSSLVERLRGGEGIEQIQEVQELSVRGAAITTRRQKRNTS